MARQKIRVRTRSAGQMPGSARYAWTGPFSGVFTLSAISRPTVGISRRDQLQMKAEIILFRFSPPYFLDISTPKGSKSRLNITIGHFALYSIGHQKSRKF